MRKENEHFDTLSAPRIGGLSARRRSLTLNESPAAGRVKFMRFTLIELLTVIAIIAILASMLQTSLFQSKERAKFARWTVYTNNLRSDPTLVGQWTFNPDEILGGSGGFDAKSPNKAFGLGVEGYKKENMDAFMIGVERLRKGRWLGKGALYFPGKRDSFIEIDDRGALNPGESDYTVYLWFNPTTRNTRYLITKGDNRKGGYLIYANRRLRFSGRATNRKRFRSKRSKNLELNKWHMAALVFDQSNNLVKMYLDGEKFSEQAIRRPRDIRNDVKVGFESSLPFLIGARNGGRRPFRGYIDEVEVFKRAFTDREIRAAYDMGKL